MSQSDDNRSISPHRPAAADRRPSSDLAVSATSAEQRAFAAWGVAEPEVGAGASASLDAQIIAVGAGDRRQFEDLFQFWAPRAKAYLIRRGVSPCQAEDLVISMMVEIWGAARTFNPAEVTGQAWIFQRVRDVVRCSALQFYAVRP